MNSITATSPLSLPADDGARHRIDWRDLIICAVLALVTFTIYIRSANFDFVDYDDGQYVFGNSHVQQGLTLANLHWAITTNLSGNWHPLTLFGDLLISTVFGPRPGAFHVVNLLIHSTNVVLLYVVLLKLTGARWPSVLAAALWGWHPLRVESVAWVSEFKDVLFGFFWLWCVLAYEHYRKRPTPWRYAAVAILLALSLLSKSMAVTLPLVLLLLDLWPLRPLEKRKDDWRTRVLEKLPLLMLSLAMSALTAYLQRSSRAAVSWRLFPLRIRITNALMAYISYLSKTFLPIHLGVFYPHPAMLQQEIPPLKWIGALMLLLIITSWALFRWRSRPFVTVGWLWFLGTLIPVIGIIQVGEQAMADRYSYLPGMGLSIAVVWLIADLVNKRWFWQRLSFVVGIVACAALAAATFVQVGYWRNTRTLFSHSYEVIPNNYLALANLASFAMADGKNEQAIRYGEQAVALAPNDPNAHESLAQAFQAAGRNKEAAREFESAITLDSHAPILRNEYGGLLMQEQKIQDAIDQFREAIRFDPNFLAARQNLAMLLATQGKYDEAIAEWKKGLAIEPANGATHGWMAEALRITGKPREAVEHYRAAIAAGERNPTWETNLAWLLATNPNASSDELEQAVSVAKDASEQTHHEQPGALDALAAALARLGRFDDAVMNAQAAAMAADAQNNPRLAADIRTRLNAYRAGHIYIIEQQAPGKP
jgi:tetratricopeptide (TPR) repeat protein